eukprot:2760453-Pyramimonas_sp.AAC.1
MSEIEEKSESFTEVELQGTGSFLDEEDMRDKYKNKPKRLQGILDRARRFTDPISGVELIEDMEYKSLSRTGQGDTSSVKRTANSEEQYKPPKKKKAEQPSAAD